MICRLQRCLTGIVRPSVFPSWGCFGCHCPALSQNSLSLALAGHGQIPQNNQGQSKPEEEPQLGCLATHPESSLGENTLPPQGCRQGSS